eukprot:691434-Hanusia_phi.AAC.1
MRSTFNRPFCPPHGGFRQLAPQKTGNDACFKLRPAWPLHHSSLLLPPRCSLSSGGAECNLELEEEPIDSIQKLCSAQMKDIYETECFSKFGDIPAIRYQSVLVNEEHPQAGQVLDDLQKKIPTFNRLFCPPHGGFSQFAPPNKNKGSSQEKTSRNYQYDACFKFLNKTSLREALLNVVERESDISLLTRSAQYQGQSAME